MVPSMHDAAGSAQQLSTRDAPTGYLSVFLYLSVPFERIELHKMYRCCVSSQKPTLLRRQPMKLKVHWNALKRPSQLNHPRPDNDFIPYTINPIPLQAPDDSDGQEAKESTTASKWALTFFWKYLENALGKNKSDEVRASRLSSARKVACIHNWYVFALFFIFLPGSIS